MVNIKGFKFTWIVKPSKLCIKGDSFLSSLLNFLILYFETEIATLSKHLHFLDTKEIMASEIQYRSNVSVVSFSY